MYKDNKSFEVKSLLRLILESGCEKVNRTKYPFYFW